MKKIAFAFFLFSHCCFSFNSLITHNYSSMGMKNIFLHFHLLVVHSGLMLEVGQSCCLTYPLNQFIQLDNASHIVVLADVNRRRCF